MKPLVAVLLIFWFPVATLSGAAVPPSLASASPHAAPMQNAAPAPWVAYTLQGSVYLVRAYGGGRHRVTTREDASEPALAPGGRFVAFLSSPPSTVRVKSVRVARTGGPPKAGVAVRQGTQTLGSLAWSPNGRQLAFVSRCSVWVWNVAGQRASMVLPGTQRRPLRSPIWSPDSRKVAASFGTTLLQHGIPAPRLGVAVANTTTRRRKTEFISFPAWLPAKARHFVGGSAPGAVFGWARDGSLLASTTFLGAGQSLTGVWRAPAGGGAARLIVGTVKKRRLVPGGPFDGTTSALLSPDRSELLLNPGNSIWIGPSTGGHGRSVSLHVNAGFVVSQVAWEGKHELAFVRLRVKPHDTSEWFLMKLSSFSLESGHTTPLAHLWSPGQDQLEVAAPTRCAGCGV